MSAKQIPAAGGIRRRILALLKDEGEATTAAIAGRLGITYEAARQQVRQLEAAGLLAPCRRPNRAGAGRPACAYRLTPAGDHLFPKRYDELAVALLDAVAETFGPAGLRQALARLSEAQVAEWVPRLAGISTAERLQSLREFYVAGDPFTEAGEGDGALWLVERNCPFLDVASRRPALCSVTVNSLARLLGYRVSRDLRFQNGDGRCLFRVHLARPLAPDAPFELEDEEPAG
jgi:predicted ArsR family transcriptional regulator